MEVELKMYIWEEDAKRQPDSFNLLAFYPGNMANQLEVRGKHWSKFSGNQSVLPIANFMELAYKLNNMVIYKESDLSTPKLINGHILQKRFDGKLDVFIKNKTTTNLWQGSYKFDFFVQNIKANNRDGEGNQWDIALLEIIDKTETRVFPTD